MVTVDQIVRVKQALATGCFESKIRKATGLSGGMIKRIMAGEFDSIIEPADTHCPDCGGAEVPCVFCAVRKSQDSEVCNIALVSLGDLAAIGAAVGSVRKASVDHSIRSNELLIRWGVPAADDEQTPVNPRLVRERLNRNYSGKGRRVPNEAQRRSHPFRNTAPAAIG